jgi:serine/threonine-protein kinase
MRRSSEPHPVSGRHPGHRDLLVGTWLDDRYLVEERIATGGFGAVYRARTAAGASLALKILHPSLTADPNAVARFEREGATLTRLHDPHTVTTLAVGEAGDGTRYIAMELLTGESLQARLARERTLPWQTAVAIARALCSSLAEAHALGVVHRDLKPDNVCVEQRAGAERVKLIDFGIVKLAPGSAIDDGKELTCAGHMIGTYDYMSPEQIIGGTCDAASDLYSLGVVLYEMLTGQRPFARLATPAAMMTALLTRTPQPPSVLVAIPPALDRIVMRCLEREPAQRWSSAAELGAALDRLLAHRLTAREEITAVHPMFPGAPRPAPACTTWSDDRWSLRSSAGEDAAICRDLGATWADDDRLAPIDERRERSPVIAPRWTDPRGIPAMSPSRSSAAAMSPSAPVPAPPRTPRGSALALGSFDGGATLPGVAVATERRSQSRVAEPTVPAEPVKPAPAWLAAAVAPRPSAEVMLAPSIPTTPLIRRASRARRARPAPVSGAAVLICAALVAAVASFLLATLL